MHKSILNMSLALLLSVATSTLAAENTPENSTADAAAAAAAPAAAAPDAPAASSSAAAESKDAEAGAQMRSNEPRVKVFGTNIPTMEGPRSQVQEQMREYMQEQGNSGNTSAQPYVYTDQNGNTVVSTPGYGGVYGGYYYGYGDGYYQGGYNNQWGDRPHYGNRPHGNRPHYGDRPHYGIDGVRPPRPPQHHWERPYPNRPPQGMYPRPPRPTPPGTIPSTPIGPSTPVSPGTPMPR